MMSMEYEEPAGCMGFELYPVPTYMECPEQHLNLKMRSMFWQIQGFKHLRYAFLCKANVCL